jgi:hypothetical protein
MSRESHIGTFQSKCTHHKIREFRAMSLDAFIIIIVYSLIPGAEPFLRRTCQDFMEPEGSLPCSQEPSTGVYPEPHQPHMSYATVRP